MFLIWRCPQVNHIELNAKDENSLFWRGTSGSFALLAVAVPATFVALLQWQGQRDMRIGVPERGCRGSVSLSSAHHSPAGACPCRRPSPSGMPSCRLPHSQLEPALLPIVTHCSSWLFSGCLHCFPSCTGTTWRVHKGLAEET